MLALVTTAGTTACLGAAWFGAATIARASQVRSLRRRCRDEGVLSLTYDDGPGRELSCRLLELLQTCNARATFFYLGRALARNGDVARAALAAGHEIGSHSFLHLNAWRALPPKDVMDLRRGVDAAAQYATAPAIFRPPYGKMTLAGYAWSRAVRVRPVWWTVDSGDTWRLLPKPEAVLGQVERAGGGVVLMHDFDRSGGGEADRRHYVLELTRQLLELAGRRGWKVRPVGELLDRKGDPGRSKAR